MKQWSYDYSNRRHGHIITPDGGPFLVVVYPANPPYVGSLELRSSDTLDGAVKEANSMAAEESNASDWTASR